jgi:Ran GTPase-activating protein (RanGAP) involved in mRNA processing and transport
MFKLILILLVSVFVLPCGVLSHASLRDSSARVLANHWSEHLRSGDALAKKIWIEEQIKRLPPEVLPGVFGFMNPDDVAHLWDLESSVLDPHLDDYWKRTIYQPNPLTFPLHDRVKELKWILNHPFYHLDLSGLSKSLVSALEGTSVPSNSVSSTLVSLKLDDLDLSNQMMQPVSSLLKASRNLAFLHLSANNFTPASLELLSLSLKHNPELKTLVIANNTIGAEGISSLVRILEDHPKLRSLGLADTMLGGNEMIKLSQALEHNPELRNLDVSYNEFGLDGIDALTEVLKNRTNLTSLSLRKTGLTPLGIEIAAIALENSKNLRYLNLSGNRIRPGLQDSDQETASLYALLDGKLQLTQLDLSETGLTDEDIEDLGELLSEHSQLQELSLSNNRLTNSSVSVLANTLQAHSRLRLLVLGNNQFDSNASRDLGMLIGNKHSLQSLDIRGMQLDSKGVQLVADALRNHANFSILVAGGCSLNFESTQVLVNSLKNRSMDVLYLDNNSLTPEESLAISHLILETHDMQQDSKQQLKLIHPLKFLNTAAHLRVFTIFPIKGASYPPYWATIPLDQDDRDIELNQ